MFHRAILSQICGSLLILLGLLVISGWIFHIEALTSVLPNYINMVFNTAFCFVLTGIILLSIHYRQTTFWQKSIPLSVGGLILLISVLVASQTLFGYSLGIDQLVIKVHISDINPYPGRMALNTSICFVMAALVFMLIPFTQRKWVAIVVQALIFLLFLVSLSALLGYLLKLDFLFGWYRYSQMAIHTASGMLVLAISLTVTWICHPNYELMFKHKIDLKIIFLSIMVLFFTAYIALFVGFAASAKENEQLLQSVLKQSQQYRQTAIISEVEHSSKSINNIIESIQFQLHEHGGLVHPEALPLANFSYLSLSNSQGELLYQWGKPIANVSAALPLNMPYHAQLQWQNGLSLKYDIALLLQNGQQIQLRAEWPIKMLNLNTDDSFGDTSEIVICGIKTANVATCLPSKLTPHPFEMSLKRDTKQPVAMSYALNGDTGILNFTGYRNHRVIGAYGPIGQLGIGIVSKVDAVDLYSPIRESLQKNILILIIAIFGSVSFMCWQIHPLVKRVLESEREAQKQKALFEESEKRFHAAFDYAAIGMALADTKGRWLKINAALTELTGYSEAEFLQMDYQSITYEEDRAKDLIHHEQLLKGEIPAWHTEKRFYHKLGHIIWTKMSVAMVFDDNNKPLYFVALIHDISKEKAAEEVLVHQASHDTLTGLANRAGLESALHLALNLAKRNHEHIAVLFCDLDHFKSINDNFGHVAGDAVLKHVADTLKYCTRATDIIARLGGDEFVIVLNQMTNKQDIEAIAQKFIEQIRKPMVLNGQTIHLTTSIGISLYPENGENISQLLTHADAALYQAKQEGRNRYCFSKHQWLEQSRRS